MRTIKLSSEDRVFFAINYIFLTCAFVVVAFPLLYILANSFSDPAAVIAGRVWIFPVGFSLKGYKAVFENNYIISGYSNAIYYTVVGTLLNLVMTTFAAYPLARKRFKFKNYAMFFFAFTMFFGGGLIPLYLLIKDLGLINTRAVMIIPGAISVYNMIIMRTYFQANIPDEMLESAQLDGCSDIKFLYHIVIPLSKAILAVMVLFYAVGHWNAYFDALLFLNSKDKYPLQLILREILVLNSIDASMLAGVTLQELEARLGMKDLLKYSLIVVASVPVLVMYPFVQKYFVQGVMIGAVKG